MRFVWLWLACGAPPEVAGTAVPEPPAEAAPYVSNEKLIVRVQGLLDRGRRGEAEAFDEAAKDGTMDGKDHPGLKRYQGHIGFLGHGAGLQFRKIKIAEINPAQ